MTKSQIDKLGEQIRSGRADVAVRRMLAELYAAYAGVAEQAFSTLYAALEALAVVNESGFIPSAARRPTKTLDSIAAKLARERTRLSSMQDIIGCRVIVENRRDQDVLTGSLMIAKEAKEQRLAGWLEIGMGEEFIEKTLKRPLQQRDHD